MTSGPLAEPSLLADGHIPVPVVDRPGDEVVFAQDDGSLYAMQDKGSRWIMCENPVEIEQ